MRIYILIIALFFVTFVNGQDTLGRVHLSGELLGVSDIYSLNIEYKFKPGYFIESGISWVPGTWQLNGENDRSFLYVPLMIIKQFGKSKIRPELSVGTIQQFTLHKKSSDLMESSPQFSVGFRYFAYRSVFVKANMYVKSPYVLAIDRYEVFVYKEPTWLIWPGFSIGTRF
jgi:hypothetical protein